MKLADGYNNIIVPRAAMPIIGPKEPLLGNKKQVNKQYHSVSFHIRHNRTHYTVHMDRVDPLGSPLGNPLVDVPEYLAGPQLHS